MNTPTKPTFHKHGKDWFPHTPGDPCPVDKDAMVLILTKDMEESDVPEPASSWCWDRLDRWPDARVLGWRYADPQPEIAESAPVELARLREENANMRTAINAADYLVSIARADLVPGSFTKDTLDQAIEALQPFTQP